MGVPSFYRWLVNKYPNIRVKAAIETKGDDHDGDDIDSSSSNPNGMEFDNLYLDMNGIIHPCFHPHDHQSVAPNTYEDVFRRIYEYIDNIVSIVRPRKLIYLAIDGVAPRAKMNQQRSRRFRTAKDNEIAEAEENRLRMQFEMEGKPVLQKLDREVSDSNVITPGTEFMHRLSKKLEGYIKSRLNSHPGWKGIQVILSDANVPGEGEHKIMSFIRYQRSIPSYNSNTRHCLYGLDADLIMLALATHEVHFSILREDVLIQEQQPVFQFYSRASNQAAESHHSMKSRGCFNDVKTEAGLFKDFNTSNKYAPAVKRPYEFLHLWILRQYLELDMKMTDVPENFEFDLERIIDDLIFMFFFAGNDFLPHMPTLEIHEGAMDLLMTVYKEHFKNIGGYLVNMQRVQDKKGGYIKLKRVEKFILLVSTFEEKIFKKRSELRERSLKRLCQDSDIQDEENEIENSDFSRNLCKNSCADKDDEILRNTKELKEKLKENLRKKSDLNKNGYTDKVRLGNPGWKERYYKQKFSAETKQEIENRRKEIVQKYTEGLVWVLHYYFNGVPSWSWFYPYHYGPFASDLKGLSQVRVKFQKGHPFKPFDQLMSVLPPRSAHALPKPYAKLITNTDSRIIEFYPTDFIIDLDGKRNAWQGVCKLPFIDKERLLVETRRVEKELTPEETERNSEKVDRLFVSSTSKTRILTFLTLSGNGRVHIDANVSGAVAGFVRLCNHDHLTSPPDILSLLFELPDGNLHIPRPLEGVEYPAKTITEGDIQKTLLWHEYPGSKPPYSRPQSLATCSKANSSSNSPSSSTAECQQNHASREFTSDARLERFKVAGTGWCAGRGTSGFNSSMARGIADMKISEASHNPLSYGRGQTAANTFWSSGNASTHNLNHTWHNRSSQANPNNALSPSSNVSTQNSSHSWRRSSQANTNPPRQSRGRGQPDRWTQKKKEW